MSANGKVKPDVVTVGGVEVVCPTGHYELGSYSESKRVWTRMKGTSATDALNALNKARKTANAVLVANDAGVQVVVDPKRVVLREAAPKFVQAALDRKSKESAEIYERTLTEFLDGCNKTYADELTHDDVIKFHGQMRRRGLADRTVFNRHINLRAFLISLGFNGDQLKKIAGEKAPRFEKTLPEIYEPDKLTAFFKSLGSDYDRLLFNLLLKSGLREREAMHLKWIDISSAHRTLLVRSKPRYRHKIKDCARSANSPSPLISSRSWSTTVSSAQMTGWCSAS